MGASRPDPRIFSNKFPDLIQRLQDYHLTFNVTLTASDRTTPVWLQLHNKLVTHSRQHNLQVFSYNLDADVGNIYAHSPWTLLEGGYRVSGGQKLKLCPLAGYEITLNGLGRVAAKLKNPNSAMSLLIFGIYLYQVNISYAYIINSW